jgi:hypothetical protein
MAWFAALVAVMLAAHAGGAPGGDLPSPAEAGFAKAGAALTQLLGARSALAEDVDLELVLAADVSRSVDDVEFQLQRQGYAAALTDRRVMMAIRSGPIGKIALCVFEWSGEFAQKVIIDWMVVGDEESAAFAAERLLSQPRPFAERTAIGVALEYALALFPRNVHKGARRTIDVSGDGTNTNGIFPSIVRDRAVAAGVTINGLVILSPEPMPWNPMHTHPPGGLPQYFEKNVIGGPGAFAMVVEDHKTFVQAMTSKLIKEIAGDVRRQAAKID